MSTLDNILENIEEILESFELEPVTEEQLDEKIMSKKKARRLRKQKRAKLKARLKAKKEKEAQEKEELELQLQQQNDTDHTENAESNKDGDDEQSNDKDTTETDEEQEFQPLVQYQEQEDEGTMSDGFQKLIEAVGILCQQHKQDLDKANEMWKSAGDNAPCPQEAWDIYNNSLKTFQDGIERLVEEYLQQENISPKELQYTDKIITALNGYIEKAQKELLAAKPDFSKDDIALLTNSSNALATTDDDDNQVATVEPDTKRKSKDLVTWNVFCKVWNPLYHTFGDLNNGLLEIGKFGVKALWKAVLMSTNFVSDKAWGFLTSPLATDFVKTLAYSNPFTALIFDGKVGSLGLGNVAKKVKDSITKANHDFHVLDINFKKNHTKRGLLKSVGDDFNINKIKREYYGNGAICSLVNAAYNYPKVSQEHKANLLTYTRKLDKAIKDNDASESRKYLKLLTNECNDICDDMSWNTPQDWRGILNMVMKKRGNTGDETTEIENKSKKKAAKLDDENNNQPALGNKSKDKLKTRIESLIYDAELSDTESVDKLKDKYSEQTIQQLIDEVKEEHDKPNESLVRKINKLNMLLNEALQ